MHVVLIALISDHSKNQYHGDRHFFIPLEYCYCLTSSMCEFTILVVVRFIDVVVVIILLGIAAVFHEKRIENAVALTPIYFYR